MEDWTRCHRKSVINSRRIFWIFCGLLLRSLAALGFDYAFGVDFLPFERFMNVCG